MTELASASDKKSIFFAFYGWDEEVEPREFVNFFRRIEAVADVRLTVTEVSNSGDEKITRPGFAKLIRIIEQGEYPYIEGVTAYTSHTFFKENGYSQLITSFNQKINIDELDTASSSRILSVSICFNTWKKMNKGFHFIFDECPRNFMPKYGFVKTADAKSMTGPYSSGISPDYGDDGFNGLQMVLLQQIKPVELSQSIIDVFPVNYIGRSHLQRQIEGVPFEKWATAVAGSEFYSVKPDLWVWRVDPVKDLWESGVPHELRYDLRKRLHDAGILLSSGLPWSELVRIAETVVDGM